jgi:nucleotide-binding universal stress UspA family protein
LKHLFLADDLSNQSLFGFRRSLRLKQIALQFCQRIGSELKIVHVDHPKAFQYQEPLYKKYLDHVRLNRKIRYETMPEGNKVRVEYVLEEGEPISTILEKMKKSPPVSVMVGTSNRFRMGAFRIGGRAKRLVTSTTLPVFIFGIGAIKNFEYQANEEFRILFIVDTGVVTDHQLKSLKSIASLYRAKLEVVFFGRKATWFQSLQRWVLGLFQKPPPSVDFEKLKKVFSEAGFKSIKSGFSLRLSLSREVRRVRPHLVAVPEDFGISPFVIARRSKIPVWPLRGR